MNLPRKFDIREKARIFAAIFVVWLAGDLAVAFFVNLPRSEEVRGLRDACDSFEGRFVKRKEKVDAMKAEYDRVMGGRRSLQTFFQDVLSTKRERMPAVQQEIRDIAAKFQIKPENIAYSKDVFKGDRVVKFAAVLPLNGSYENLRAFISAVENSQNFLVIDSIALTDSKEGGIVLNLQITVATYFVDPDMAAAPVAATKGT
jgi:Tfp pilus assembly protein PilO